MKHRYTKCHHVVVAVLIAAREASGLTQRELSAKLKRSKGFVHNLEAGSMRRIDVCEFADYAKACGADPARLLEQVYESPRKSPHRSGR